MALRPESLPLAAVAGAGLPEPVRRIVLNAAGAALLRSVEPALAQLDEGVRAAAVAATGVQQRIRVTLVPSFAQRGLLPRMALWRERHPDILMELHTSQAVVDLVGEGFHAALRQGEDPWRGLASEVLIDSPMIAVGAPDAARRLQGRGITLARELLAADALREGRLVRLSPLSLSAGGAQTLSLVHPTALRDWPPLQALQTWLKDELARSRLQWPEAAP